MLNPTSSSQVVTVSVFGRDITRTLTVGPRSRVSVELGSWGLEGDFGLEVRCGGVCAASLTMWDGPYKNAHESVPVVGCAYQ